MTYFQIYFALREWRLGECENAEFLLAAHEDVYYSHIEMLQKIHLAKPTVLHHILSKICKDAMYVFALHGLFWY
jgi:hypothetical protein